MSCLSPSLILLALFAAQSRGTASVAAFFGPVTLVWFVAIAGGRRTLRSAKPDGAAGRSTRSTAITFLLGSRCDRIHDAGRRLSGRDRFRSALCGPRAISAKVRSSAAWLGVALPALTINYLGQGRSFSRIPKAIENPFFLLYPDWALAADDRAGDCGYRHREPGGHYGSLFPHTTGDPARLVAAPRNPAHVGNFARAKSIMPKSQYCCC